MGATSISENDNLVLGYELFQGLDDSGQLNFYESVRDSLEPFFTTVDGVSILGFGVTYFAEIKIQSANFQFLSKKAGYPDRYDFGQFRWLSGAASCPVNFVDTFQWIDPVKRNIWVVQGTYPNRTFPTAPPSTLTPFDFIRSISAFQNFFNAQAYQNQAAEQFAWSMNKDVQFDICIFWLANRVRFFIEDGAPPPSIFWYFV